MSPFLATYSTLIGDICRKKITKSKDTTNTAFQNRNLPVKRDSATKSLPPLPHLKWAVLENRHLIYAISSTPSLLGSQCPWRTHPWRLLSGRWLGDSNNENGRLGQIRPQEEKGTQKKTSKLNKTPKWKTKPNPQRRTDCKEGVSGKVSGGRGIRQGWGRSAVLGTVAFLSLL